MADFTTIASDVISDTRMSGDINASLAKIASTHNFNEDESQRLVEETNIAMFLEKMQNGTQHEDYELASPISAPSSSVNGGVGSLGKTASVGVDHFFATPDMYDLSIHSEPLMKTASNIDMADINIGDMNSEEEWELKKEASAKFFDDDLQKEALSHMDTVVSRFISDLSYSIKGDPDLLKTALAMTHTDDTLFSDNLISDTHLKVDEIMDGEITKESVSRLNKIASGMWELSLVKLGAISDGAKNTLSDTKNLVKYPFRNPKTTLGIVGSAYVANMALSNDRELEERRKMMKIDTENNNA